MLNNTSQSSTTKTRRRSVVALVVMAFAVACILAVVARSRATATREEAQSGAGDLVRNEYDYERAFGLDEGENEFEVRRKKFIFKKLGKKLKKHFSGGKYRKPIGLPTLPFKLFYVITRTPYQNNQAKFLKDYGFSYVVKASCKSRQKWKVCAYKDTRRKLLYVSFRGSYNINNYLHDIEHVMGGNRLKKLTRSFNGDVGRMIKNNRGYKLYMIVGHSAGGYFALRVQKGRKVWRLTLNALQVVNGDYNINLRSKLDPVSVYPFSKKDRYLTVVSGSHSATVFNKKRNKSFRQLSGKLKKLRTIRLPGSKY